MGGRLRPLLRTGVRRTGGGGPAPPLAHAGRPETVLLAAVDGRPLGLTFFGPSPGPGGPGRGEVFSVYAHPDGWGSGVAAALMDATLEHLRADGFARAHLWTLRDTPRSRRFYAKCGFHETGARRPYDFGDGNPLEQVEYERPC